MELLVKLVFLIWYCFVNNWLEGFDSKLPGMLAYDSVNIYSRCTLYVYTLHYNEMLSLYPRDSEGNIYVQP